MRLKQSHNLIFNSMNLFDTNTSFKGQLITLPTEDKECKAIGFDTSLTSERDDATRGAALNTIHLWTRNDWRTDCRIYLNKTGNAYSFHERHCSRCNHRLNCLFGTELGLYVNPNADELIAASEAERAELLESGLTDEDRTESGARRVPLPATQWPCAAGRTKPRQVDHYDLAPTHFRMGYPRTAPDGLRTLLPRRTPRTDCRVQLQNIELIDGKFKVSEGRRAINTYESGHACLASDHHYESLDALVYGYGDYNSNEDLGTIDSYRRNRDSVLSRRFFPLPMNLKIIWSEYDGTTKPSALFLVDRFLQVQLFTLLRAAGHSKIDEQTLLLKLRPIRIGTIFGYATDGTNPWLILPNGVAAGSIPTEHISCLPTSNPSSISASSSVAAAPAAS
jgi:hypothetical protein